MKMADEYSNNDQIRYNFILEVLSNFIGKKGNFIYFTNFERIAKYFIEYIIGIKEKDKKKYLKIKNRIDDKLSLKSKSKNQQNRIKEYLKNYPENTKYNLSSNSTIPARSSIRFPNNNESERPNTNNINEKTPLLGRKNKKSFFLSSNGTGTARSNTNNINEKTPLLGRKNKKSFSEIFGFFLKKPANSSP